MLRCKECGSEYKELKSDEDTSVHRVHHCCCDYCLEQSDCFKKSIQKFRDLNFSESQLEYLQEHVIEIELRYLVDMELDRLSTKK